jgi:hypothetical protein
MGGAQQRWVTQRVKLFGAMVTTQTPFSMCELTWAILLVFAPLPK